MINEYKRDVWFKQITRWYDSILSCVKQKSGIYIFRTSYLWKYFMYNVDYTVSSVLKSLKVFFSVNFDFTCPHCLFFMNQTIIIHIELMEILVFDHV